MRFKRYRELDNEVEEIEEWIESIIEGKGNVSISKFTNSVPLSTGENMRTGTVELNDIEDTIKINIIKKNGSIDVKIILTGANPPQVLKDFFLEIKNAFEKEFSFVKSLQVDDKFKIISDEINISNKFLFHRLLWIFAMSIPIIIGSLIFNYFVKTSNFDQATIFTGLSMDFTGALLWLLFSTKSFENLIKRVSFYKSVPIRFCLDRLDRGKEITEDYQYFYYFKEFLFNELESREIKGSDGLIKIEKGGGTIYGHGGDNYHYVGHYNDGMKEVLIGNRTIKNEIDNWEDSLDKKIYDRWIFIPLILIVIGFGLQMIPHII